MYSERLYLQQCDLVVLKAKIENGMRGRLRADSYAAKLEKKRVWRLQSSAGRLLVSLAALILLLMPWTEHYWTFDGFLHGHPDLELSLLSIVTMFCLLLLLASMAKHGWSFFLAFRRWFNLVFDKADLIARLPFCGFRCDSPGEPKRSPALGFYNLPLQI